MSIEPGVYTRQDVFDHELERLFAARFYVGTVCDFAEVDAYRSMILGATAFTMRRTTEGPRAFNNVCLHRCSLIDPLGTGRRPFRCGYHGWGYDAEGKLRSTPLVENPTTECARLREYPVSQSAGLVFVGLNGSAPDVAKVEHAAQLAGSPLTAEMPFYRGSLLHACNWKIMVENVVEGYHLSFVHRKTFLPAGFNSKSEYVWGQDGYTSWHLMSANMQPRKQSLLNKIAPASTRDFRHAYIFPNLFMGSLNSLVGFRHHMVPLNALETLLELELFELPALKALSPAVREHMRAEAVKFTTETLLEDKPLVESCQVGISCTARPIQLQQLETRVRHFHTYYREQMNNAPR